MELKADATDLELEILSYEWSAEKGEITPNEDDDSVAIWKAPEEPGVYMVTVRVSDATQEVELAIELEVLDLFQLETNKEPLSETTIVVGDSLNLNLSAASSSYDSLKYNWIALDDTGKEVEAPSPSDSSSAVWRPLKYGGYTVLAITENTAHNDKATDSLTVTVMPRLLVDKTVLTIGASLGVEVATDATPASTAIYADPQLSYNWEGEYITPEEGKEWNVRFQPEVTGDYLITASVNDTASGNGATVATTVTVQPRLIAPKTILAAGEVMTLEVIASVPGATPSLTYSWSASSKVSASSGSFSTPNGRATDWTVPASPGLHTLTAQVTKNGVAAGSISVDLEVADGWQVLNRKNLVGLPSDRIGAVLVEGNTLWLGGSEGLFKVALSSDPPTIEASYNTSSSANGVITSDQINALELDDNGDLWVGTAAGGLFKAAISVGNDSWTWQSFPLTQNSQTISFDLTALIVDKDGNIWTGSDGGGVIRHDSGSSDLAGTTVSALAKGSGTIWAALGSSNAGDKTVISSLSETGSWVGTYSATEVNADFVSKEGTASDPEFVDLVSLVIGALAFSGDDIWTTVQKWERRKLTGIFQQVAGGGVSSYDGSNWVNYNVDSNSLPSDLIKVIKTDSRGRVWVGTLNGGLSMFDGISWNIYNVENSPLPSNFVLTIFIDSQDNAWVGTVNGLAKIQIP